MEDIQGYRFAIDLDDGGMTRSLKEIRNEAKLLKSAMRANFVEINSTGDAMKAYSSKVNDAKRAIEGQEAVIRKLKDSQNGLDTSTEKGRNAYVRYQQQIERAKTEIGNLSSQQERAQKSVDLYKSGIVELQKSTRLATDANEAFVKRLVAEGKTSEATTVKIHGLKDAYTSLNGQLKIEQKRLSDVAKESGKDSDAYKTQSIKVNELGTKIAETRRQLDKVSPTGFNRLLSSVHKTNENAEKTSHLFGRIFGGQMLSNGVIAAWSSLTSHIEQAVAAGKQFDIEQQKMHATWDTLTGSMAKSNAMVKTINQYSVATGQDQDLVDELEQGYYHLHSNRKEANAMTRASLNMADAVGINKQQSLAVRQDMVNGLSRGNVNAGLLNQTSQYFPMFREALAKYLTEQIKSGKETFASKVKEPNGKTRDETMKSVHVDDLPSMSKAGVISAGDFEKTFEYLGNDKYKAAADNMMKTMYGMQRTIEARVPALLGAMEKPFMDAKNPLYAAVSKWVSDPRTDKEFSKVGRAANGGIQTITKAFAKAFDIKSAPQAMNHAMNALANGVTRASKDIAHNAPEIISFFKAIKGTGDVGLKTFIDSLKIANFLLKPFIELIGSHADTVAKFAAVWLVASKGLKIFEASLKAIDNLKGTLGRATEIFGIKKETTALTEQNAELKRNIELQDASATGGGSTGGKASKEKSAVQDVEQSVGGGSGKEAKVLTDAEDVGKDSKSLRRFIPKLHGLSDLKSVTGAGKALVGSVGALDVINAGTDLIGTTKKTAGSHVGAAAGNLGGTAVGAMIGTAILPGLGTAIGAGLGGMAGEGIGRKFGKAIQKGISLLKVKVPKISVGDAYDKLDAEVKKHYKTQADQDTKNLKLLYKNGDITKSEYEHRLAIVKSNESKMSRFTTMGEKDRNAIAKYYSESKQKLTEKWNQKILNDEVKYGKNSSQVEKDRQKKSKALQQQELDFATKVTVKEARLHTTLAGKIKLASDKQESILKKLTKEKGKLDKDQLEQAVASSNKERKTVDKNAEETYKKTVASAKKKYRETVNAAKDEFKGNSSYAKSQRDRIIAEAKKQRDKVVDHAKHQKDDTIDHAKAQYNKTAAYAHKQNSAVTKQSAAEYENTKKNNGKMSDNFSDTWHSIWKSIGNWVGKLIHGLNKSAIKGQNQVFKQYGGSKTLEPITAGFFATGTGVFSNRRRPIVKPTLGILNDGHDSPETGNQEMVLHPNGVGELIQGTNVPYWLKPRDEVINAKELKAISTLTGLTHFAGGTGFFSGIGNWIKKAWGSLKQKLSAITGFMKHSNQSFDSTYSKAPDLDGDVAKNYTNLVDTVDKKQGQTWWATAWNEISNTASAGGGGNSALLKEAKELAKGAHYRYSETKGRLGPNYYDCSGLVYEALKHMGITVKGGSTTVPEYNFTHAVSWKNARPGDLAFFGAGGSQHVGIVVNTKGNGRMYSAENPQDGIKYGPIKSFGNFVGIRRISQLAGSDDKDSKDNKKGSPLEQLVHNQLKTSGVLSWVKKFLAPLEAKLAGDIGNLKLSGSEAQRARSIARALKKAYPAAKDGGIAGILGNWMQESRLDPSAINGSDHGTGLGQWTNGREKGLRNWLKKHGYAWNSAAGQIDYALHEPGEAGAFKAALRMSNPVAAANKFFAGWESGGAEDKTAGVRDSNARAAYRAIKGYENGGLSTQAKIAPISEHNLPEMVIPLSALKSSRGYELLGKTAAIMAKRDNLGNSSSNSFVDKKQFTKLMSKFDNVIDLLSSIVAGQQNPVPAIVSSQSVVNTISQNNKRQKINRNLGRGMPLGK